MKIAIFMLMVAAIFVPECVLAKNGAVVSKTLQKREEGVQKRSTRYTSWPGSDVRRYASMLQGVSHANFAYIMYEFLTLKYPTRDWFVLSQDLGGPSNWGFECSSGGYHLYNYYRRNIRVASVPKRKGRLSRNTYTRLAQIPTRNCKKFGSLLPTNQQVYNALRRTFPPCTYAAGGVVYRNKRPSYRAASSRLFVKNTSRLMLYVFG